MRAISLGLFSVVAAQAPGRIVADTKTDLLVDPLRFLGQATRLWTTGGGMGYVPNQAWGYLFPMGPFFALGHLAHVPTWFVQRLWMALIITVAFRGMHRLATELGLATRGARILGALAYCTTPSLIGSLGLRSGGIPLALAIAPWVVVPLVRGARSGSPRRAAAWSVLAFVCAGSVNAAIALSVLPTPALFLLTRERGLRRRRLMMWWGAGIVATSAWFLGAVVVLQRFGFDFTKTTEQAADTTATSSATEIVRGTSNWLAYLKLPTPWNDATNLQVSSGPVILATALVAAVGMAGLTHRRNRERAWLAWSLLAGFVVQAAGYVGVWGGPFSAQTRRLLDGALVALRNVDKLAPLLAVPIALGLVQAFGSAAGLATKWRAGIRIGIIAVVLVGFVPIIPGHLLGGGSFAALPGYWREAATWVEAQGNGTRTVVMPSANFGDYTWGRPLDEPMQLLATTPWAARNLFPAGGSLQGTRVLDAVDRALAGGQGIDGLADYLGRAGIGIIVVRNDLDRTRSGTVAPSIIHASLAASRGITLATSFGPVVDDGLLTDQLVADVGGLSARHAIEIYRVATDAPLVSVASARSTRVVGGPEVLLGPALGLVGATAIGGADDAAGTTPTSAVVTDATRRTSVTFGDSRAAFNSSYPLTGNEWAAGANAPPRDYRDRPDEPVTVASLDGAASISASSYFGLFVHRPETQPAAAFDGDPSTAWVVSDGTTGGLGQWIEVDFKAARAVDDLSLRLLTDVWWRPTISQITATTERGERTTTLLRTDNTQTIASPAGTTRWLRLTIRGTTGTPAGASQVGISEIGLPHFAVARPLVVPEPPPGLPTSFVFERPVQDPLDPTRWNTEPSLDRVFTVKQRTAVTISATAVLRQPADSTFVERLTASGPASVEGSSTWFGRSTFPPTAAFDGDVATPWIADPRDPTPSLRVRWATKQVITGLWLKGAGRPTAQPTKLELTSGDESVTVDVTGDVATFPALETDDLTVTVVASAPVTGTRSIVAPPAVAIGEMAFVGADGPVNAWATDAIALSCGTGPTLHFDDVDITTRPFGNVRDILQGRAVQLEVCGRAPSSLEVGFHRITDTGGLFGLQTIEFLADVAQPTDVARSLQVTHWDDTDRTIDIGPGISDSDSVVRIAENANAGWRAVLDGKVLRPVRLDGWQQGFVVPAALAGTIHLTFTPTKSLRALLLFGIGAVGAVVAAALFRGRRGAEAPAVGPRSYHHLVADVVAGVVLLVAGGLAVLFVPIMRRLRLGVGASIVAFGGFAIAGITSAIDPAPSGASGVGSFSAVAQLSALVAIAAVAIAVVQPDVERPVKPMTPPTSSTPADHHVSGRDPEGTHGPA